MRTFALPAPAPTLNRTGPLERLNGLGYAAPPAAVGLAVAVRDADTVPVAVEVAVAVPLSVGVGDTVATVFENVPTVHQPDSFDRMYDCTVTTEPESTPGTALTVRWMTPVALVPRAPNAHVITWPDTVPEAPETNVTVLELRSGESCRTRVTPVAGPPRLP